MVHPNSLKNLRSDANPSGRPKGFNLWTNIKQMQHTTMEQLESIVSDPDAIATKMMSAQYILKCMRGDKGALEYVIDREEGKATITQNTTLDVQGLQQIGQDITPQDTKQVQSIVNTITEASSAKDALLSKMNVDIIDKD